MKILFIGGGSGGHVYPLIAVWRELQKLSPDASAHFVVSTRAEDSDYLKAEGLTPIVFDAPRANILLPLRLPGALKKARALLKELKPDAIFSKGGALSVPLCLAAKKLGIPVVLHESDAVMGRANRVISRLAGTVCLGLPVPETHKIDSTPYIVTGNPVRPEVTSGSKEEGLKITGFIAGRKPALLVYGGSQGSQALNEWTAANLDELLGFCDVIHLTGKGKKGAEPRDGYFVREFAFKELPHLYAVSNFAVSRAGSGTISELAANGIPACLVPLRGLAQDHQELNARSAQKEGDCLVLEQTEINEKLVSLLRVTLTKPETLAAMKTSMRRLHHPDAAKRIAEIVLKAA